MSITSYAVKASDGSNYNSVAINAKGSGAGGNGGSVARGGSVASALLDNVAVSRYNAGVFGSTVLDNDSADKALSSGTFAYDNESPVAKRLTTELAGGVANTTLLSGAAVPANVRSIHKLETLRTQRITTAIRANKYNRYTGDWDAGFPANAVDSLSTDDAATPTRSVPGELTYKTSAPLAVNDDYKPKNG
jgi:hypothetical protein